MSLLLIGFMKWFELKTWSKSDIISSIAIICWNILKYRNVKIFEKSSMPFSKIIDDSYGLIKEIKATKHSNSKVEVLVDISFWKPPSLDSFKINFDGSYIEKEAKAGVAFVICDSDGLLFVCPGKAR